MYLLGYDIGSSSVKAALVEAVTGNVIGMSQYPDIEMDITSHQPGWAEQDPIIWWEAVRESTKRLLYKTSVEPTNIKSIGIAYQMHGLVLVDRNHEVLRPSIIWCDSRAVEIGNKAFTDIGSEKCLAHCLNSPGNFTASKLKWVKDHEPDLYQRIYKVMLPGDYIVMKLTGDISTTVSGLSEGILWDFKNNDISTMVLDQYGIDRNVIPKIVETFSPQGKLSKQAADELGLQSGTLVSYRAGDQPNNAFALGVSNPNEVAATGGTSGVVYGILDQYKYDPASRVNGFAHVNHSNDEPRVGVLLCINGAGIQYAWLKKQMAKEGTSYNDMEPLVRDIPVGSDGLRILPFGNGSERMLGNMDPGAQVNNLQFNRHTKAHFYRAGLEGIAFSFVYGFQVLKELGLNPKIIKVGNDNLFRSEVFAQTIANLLHCSIEVNITNGAIGAAKGSGVGSGQYNSISEAIKTNQVEHIYRPEETSQAYEQAYQVWRADLVRLIKAE